MLSEERIEREMASLKNTVDGLRRRAATIANKQAILREDIDNFKINVDKNVELLAELESEFSKLRQRSITPAAPFDVQKQVDHTTTILKDAVVAQLSNNLAELLDALGFGKDHVQQYGMDETVRSASSYVKCLKNSESVLNNLRSILK
ncbi:hypothetical protein [Pseudomonas phage vB_PaP_HN01]|nr:hypothetical protein [Pseudomonas phage vB_PaP_HN01]